ncbi:pulmonary surfactant-associated protein C [Anolis carolinensis]|uniref:Surfactant protein C n=1 Tax=Anolis carolinensis TaxID=28377 RepID=R4G9S8_ANOCA|nr:PREDICTED: pulmonary surfactant-associated protein C [Anolis carolinensis]|eukprot:XP_008116457.1 PREDICTED: pulmonary surfactant-associated protein C [Anolis carolinensis]
MDDKSKDEINAASEPPAYKFIPRVPKERTQMILISIVLVLLVTIIIGAILIGVHVTQEHTEKIIKTITKGANGEMVKQTVMVDTQENVAVFYIHSNTTSATVVYDYQQGLIAFRIHSRKQCSVVVMDLVDVPSLHEITELIDHSIDQVSEEDSLLYTFKQRGLADPNALGTTINVLCSDVPVYWAEKNHKKPRRRSVPCPDILILELCFAFL